jgi:HEAT repeat protein
MEEALARDARIFDTIVGELIPLLSHQDAPLRGDTAELLGKIGHKAAVPALQQLESDTDPDVSEAATEALQAIAARIGS